MEESFRNPSPPPEILANDELLPDRVGESSYSRKWLYETLIKIVEYCNSCDSPKTNGDSAPEGSFHDNAEESSNMNSSDIIELDSTIEEDACNLWDMSATKDVAEFLNESKVPSIFHNIIEKTKSPRLLEIVIGILGNMSAHDSICREIAVQTELVNTILRVSGTSDTPTLKQVLRVILCGVQNTASRVTWFEIIKDNPFLFENLIFIFNNSLSCDILSDAYNLVYCIIYENEYFCNMWGQPEFVKSLIVAGHHIKNRSESLNNLFSVLTPLCCFPSNIKELVTNWEDLNTLFISHFLSLYEDDLPDKSEIDSIHICLEVYNEIIKYENMTKELLDLDGTVLNVMCRLASSVNAMITEVKQNKIESTNTENHTNNPTEKRFRRIEMRHGVRHVSVMTEEELKAWQDLVDIIVQIGKILIKFTDDEEDKIIINTIINFEEVPGNINVPIN